MSSTANDVNTDGGDFVGRDSRYHTGQQIINQIGRLADNASNEDIANLIQLALFGDKRLNFRGIVGDIDHIEKRIDSLSSVDNRVTIVEREIIEIKNLLEQRNLLNAQSSRILKLIVVGVFILLILSILQMVF